MRYKRKNIVFKSCGDVFERKNSYIYKDNFEDVVI